MSYKGECNQTVGASNTGNISK